MKNKIFAILLFLIAALVPIGAILAFRIIKPVDFEGFGIVLSSVFVFALLIIIGLFLIQEDLNT